MTTPRKEAKARPAKMPKSKQPDRAPQATVSLAAMPDAAMPARDREFLDSNVPGLGHDATNAAERHVALDHVIVDVWATEDITMIRRVESAGDCKWVMWRRTSLPPA